MKKVVALAVVLTVLLCGCRPAGQTVQTPQTEQTPEVQTEAPTQAPENTLTVQDGYAEEFYFEPWDMHYCVHFPAFVWNGDADLPVNEKILTENMAILNPNEGNDDLSQKAYYTFGKANGFGSVVTVLQYQDYDVTEYTVYHLNIATGQEASGDEILQAYGYTRESFKEQAAKVLEERFYKANGQPGEFVDEEYYQEALNDQLSEETLNGLQPFIDETGSLCMIATCYVFAGSGHYDTRICLETGELAQPIQVLCPTHG